MANSSSIIDPGLGAGYDYDSLVDLEARNLNLVTQAGIETAYCRSTNGAADTELCAATAASAPAILSQTKKRNLVFILSDDHRYDAMCCAGHPWLKTPNLDRLAKGGQLLKNAFVTTALCSPSRACTLTGLYGHTHTELDNITPLPARLVTFPQVLQKHGYRTALLGKWHMGGETDEPRPGFDRWVSFRGQGDYNDPTIHFDGQRRKLQGYVTDILTDEAERFINENKSTVRSPSEGGLSTRT